MRYPLITWMILSLLTLSGCDSAPPAGPRFDGVYAGTSTLSRGEAGWCGPETATAALTVRAGHFDYIFPVPNVTTIIVQSQILADGSFDGATEYLDPNVSLFGLRPTWVMMRGHIAGGTLDGQVENVTCARHLSLIRN